MRPVLGLDIGGANLKAAHSHAEARSRPFELWRHPDRLGDALTDLLAGMPSADAVAVTMTGELCDCFASKRHGVRHILAALPDSLGAIGVWTTAGRFVSRAEADADPLPVAAANWLALAVFAGRFAPSGAALLVDVGSTTTDVIALFDGMPQPVGRTDPQRLRSGELVYTGARRTPACALLGPGHCAELFATSLDAHLLLGHVPEEACDTATADGRPATRPHAHARLARMLGGDAESIPEADTRRLAATIDQAQTGLIAAAVERQLARLPGQPTAVIVAGSGEFLARRALSDFPIVSLAAKLGPEISTAAAAFAVATLAAEGNHGWPA